MKTALDSERFFGTAENLLYRQVVDDVIFKNLVQ